MHRLPPRAPAGGYHFVFFWGFHWGLTWDEDGDDDDDDDDDHEDEDSRINDGVNVHHTGGQTDDLENLTQE